MKKQIKFYGRTKPDPKYWPFSNFYPAPFVDSAGITWPTTEHYFQAMKFLPGEICKLNSLFTCREYIRRAKTPGEAAQIGRSRDLPLRKDWEEVKDQYMYKALWYKFTQHQDLRELLCETNDAELIEHTYKDSYWGDGGDGTGKNMLGVLLMKIRKNIIKGNKHE